MIQQFDIVVVMWTQNTATFVYCTDNSKRYKTFKTKKNN